MSDDSRSDANLRQFKSRAQQPKVLGNAPVMSNGQPEPPSMINFYVSYDSPRSSTADEIEALRFRYTGTSPQVSTMNNFGRRRMMHASLGGVYDN